MIKYLSGQILLFPMWLEWPCIGCFCPSSPFTSIKGNLGCHCPSLALLSPVPVNPEGQGHPHAVKAETQAALLMVLHLQRQSKYQGKSYLPEGWPPWWSFLKDLCMLGKLIGLSSDILSWETEWCPGREMPLREDLGSHFELNRKWLSVLRAGLVEETTIMVTDIINAHLSRCVCVGGGGEAKNLGPRICVQPRIWENCFHQKCLRHSFLPWSNRYLLSTYFVTVLALVIEIWW